MPQVILLPGLACDARLWQSQMSVVPDRLSPVASDAHMRHERIEDMAAAVLREHAGPLVLVGASMGGMVAMEAARQEPSRIAGLALLGTNAQPESAETYALRESAIELFAAGEVREVLEPNLVFAFHPKRADDPALVQRYMAMMLDAGAGQLIRQNRALMQRPDARPHLRSVLCPTLVMCGEQDLLTPPACSREIAALIPGSAMRWVPECGHMLTMEKPRFVNAVLGEWLQQFAS
ncbi:alpha/beta hydrolase [Variovorax dokdonensis]|uniref:Alpha/beta hydrolase n=1 Tax=Variovorax dokdonensis TaxID=344883 RepID=A0ABT7NBL4_9BURK|nr:alpha/beta hydrolase [Variovorax dokdonensis]MDM0045307.1 alpha/beta hydrolase [Variovorax dokdonensis]